MRVLVTGATGFVAPYLVKELLKRGGYQVSLTSNEDGSLDIDGSTFNVISCNIADGDSVRCLIEEVRPEVIFHLAAISHVGHAQSNLDQVFKVNVEGTYNLASAMTEVMGRGSFLFVSTSLVYDEPGDNKALDENSPVGPRNAYGHSKLAAEKILGLFEHSLNVYLVRSFNHTGPGQASNFVCPSFASKVKSIPDLGTIKVGDLSAIRDFTDVRDVVRAYVEIVEKQPDQKLWNIGSGNATAISSVLESFVAISGKNIEVIQEFDESRKTEQNNVVCDPSLANEVLHWAPQISLDQTFKEIFDSAI